MAYDDEQDNDDPGADESEKSGLPTRERAYIIPAQDAKGHSARVYCRVQPSLARLLADVHQSHKYPFRVQGDAVRWCIDYGLRRLASGAGIPSVMAQSDAIQAILVDEEYQLQFSENLNTMRRVVDRYKDRGAIGKARELATRILVLIRAMPEGYWRTTYETEVLSKYGELLQGKKAATANGKSSLFNERDTDS